MRKLVMLIVSLFMLTASVSANASTTVSEHKILQTSDVQNKESFPIQLATMADEMQKYLAYSKKGMAGAKDKMKDFILLIRSYSGTPFAYYNASYVYINEAVKRFNVDNPIVNIFLDPVSTTMSGFVVIADTFFGCLDNSCGFGAVFEDDYGRA